jgi:hypothetical protein
MRKSGYKNSIWNDDESYTNLGLLEGGIDPRLLPLIAQLQNVEAAKKQTPCIPLKHLVRMAEELPKDIGTLREVEYNVPKTIEVLHGLLRKYYSVKGVGVKTLLAFVAVLSDGAFPPIDKKNTKGLRKIGVISKEEEKGLNGENLKKIADIYVRKVLAQWRLKRSEGKCPREIDDMWAKAGRD